MKRGIVLAAVIAAALAGAWLLRAPPADSPRNEKSVPPTTSATPAEVRTAAPAPPRRHGTAPAVPAALPPESVPLSEAFPQLDAQARAGNARAACRIAAELHRCSTLADLVEQAEPVEETLARVQASHRGTPAELQRRIDEVQRVDAGLQDVAAHCAKWAELPNARHYLLIAARRGHAESIYRYLGLPLTGSEVLRDPQLAIDYRANAFALFQRGLEAGDVRMAGVWVRALAAPQDNAFSAVLPPEWRNRGVVKELLALLVPRFGEVAVRSGFSEPERIASSDEDRAEARRLYDRHFRNASPPRDFVPTSLFPGIEGGNSACEEVAP